MQNRHHLELTWLEDCVALAQSLNFSRAAASRYVTQPHSVGALFRWKSGLERRFLNVTAVASA